MLAAHTLSVTIDSSPGVVYEFVVNAQNLPQWAGGLCQSVTQADTGWIVHTPQGDMLFRFAEENSFGVLDHYITPPQSSEIYVPMRVLPNGTGCTVLFTLFRLPAMSDADYARDVQLVEQDLLKLKQLLEAHRTN